MAIVDPHVKIESSFKLHDEIHSQDLYVKNKDGGNFEGWCWPGKKLNNATVWKQDRPFLARQMGEFLARFHSFLSILPFWHCLGSTGYPDFTNPEMRDLWAKMFAYDQYEVRLPSLI